MGKNLENYNGNVHSQLKFHVDLISRKLSLKVIIHWFIPTDF